MGNNIKKGTVNYLMMMLLIFVLPIFFFADFPKRAVPDAHEKSPKKLKTRRLTGVVAKSSRHSSRRLIIGPIRDYCSQIIIMIN